MRRPLAALLGVLLAAPALGFIPSASKLATAAARANREAHRTRALRIEVVLRPVSDPSGLEGDAPLEAPIAEGVLLSDPRGYARVELVGLNGVHERHLLRGGAVVAARDGEPLPAPRPLLPPFPLLQAPSGEGLRGALRGLGVLVDDAALGRSHGHDCYVIGGREPGLPADESGRPSLWIDVDSYEIVRVDRPDGASFRFGPLRDFGDVRLPSWVAIARPGQRSYRLELRAAAAQAPPADAFSDAWVAGG